MPTKYIAVPNPKSPKKRGWQPSMLGVSPPPPSPPITGNFTGRFGIAASEWAHILPGYAGGSSPPPPPAALTSAGPFVLGYGLPIRNVPWNQRFFVAIPPVTTISVALTPQPQPPASYYSLNINSPWNKGFLRPGSPPTAISPKSPPPPNVPYPTALTSLAIRAPWNRPNFGPVTPFTVISPTPPPPQVPIPNYANLPIIGVPWARMGSVPLPSITSIMPSPPAPVGSSSYVPLATPGIPIKGVPWQPRIGSVGPGNVTHPSPPAPPPPPPPGPAPTFAGNSKPLIPRTPRTVDERIRRHTDQVSDIFNSLMVKGQVVQISPKEWTLVPATYQAPNPPGPTDDFSMGFVIGMQWVDTTNGQAYICLNASIGSAVWKQITV